MTDYVKDRLDNADHLLEQMKQADRNGTGLFPAERNVAVEDREDKGALESVKALPRAARGEVSLNVKAVDGLKMQDIKVNQNITSVVNEETGPDPAEKRKSGEALLNMAGGGTASRRLDGVLEQGDRPESGVSLQTERREDRIGSALAAALEQLDWAEPTRTVGTLLERRRGEFPASLTGSRIQRRIDLLEKSEAGWNSPGRMTAAQGEAVGGRQWVEQADRAFCRDSRRYDGGFYLY